MIQSIDMDMLVPHLFRQESAKIIAVLCRKFGLAHVQLAEDVVAETFLAALESWPYKGVPPNPQGWLYHVAQNKLRNLMRHDAVFRDKVAPYIQLTAEDSTFIGHADHLHTDSLDLTDLNIADSQLKMLFAVCHPSIPIGSQIALALRILCGFGIDEIASAFLTNRDTIAKRLQRAKERLRTVDIELELNDPDELVARLPAVLHTAYLLFNEGYYSQTDERTVQEELCAEAMRLVLMLMNYPPTNGPEPLALMALMCFQASRLAARKGAAGEMILFAEQDVSLWNADLLDRGTHYLIRSSGGDSVSRYHIEAMIAYWFSMKVDDTTKWRNIFNLYDCLLRIAPSPVVQLNRLFALSMVDGNEEAIAGLKKLNIPEDHFYHLLFAHLYSGSDVAQSYAHLELALDFARTAVEREFIMKKIANISFDVQNQNE